MFPFCTPWNHQKTYKMRTLGSNGLMKHQEAIFVKKLYQNLSRNIAIRKDGWNIWAYFIQFFQQIDQLTIVTYLRQFKNLLGTFIHLTTSLVKWSTSKTHFFQTYSTIGIKMIYICGSSIWSANKGKRPISKRWLQEKNAREISR